VRAKPKNEPKLAKRLKKNGAYAGAYVSA